MPLHPLVQANWDRVQASGFRGYAGMPVAQARTHFSSVSRVFGPGPDMAEVRELTIPVAGAGGTIAARLYRPTAEPRGLCVYLHGGGFVLGALDDFDTFCRTLAQRSGCALLSVDYRLAPEHPFPTPLNDTLAAIRWAQSLPEAAQGLAVAGDSAGANLVTVAALALRGELALHLQVLFNPCTDIPGQTASYAAYGEDYLLKTADIHWFMQHYAPGHDWADPAIAPLRNPDLRGAPPAWIGLAEFDVLHDEGVAYAQALQAAGTPVDLRRYDGVMHGFARGHGAIDTADRAVTEAAQALRAAFS